MKQHDAIRNILIKYGNPEFGDAIIDEICWVFDFPTTTDVEKDPCPHEDDITYGKHVQVDATHQLVHMLCTSCNAVGTVLEVADDDDPDSWQSAAEIWHQPGDYWRADMANDMVIKLMYKGEVAT